MKISRNWLQGYFTDPLPSAEQISDAYTFHAFEIEEAAGDVMDVKVLPNRAADCLSHRGLAKDLAAILDVPLAKDPLRDAVPMFPQISELAVTIEDEKKCLRYMGALVKGVKVAPSPAWLREALEAVGQRSINNVVDATNYVMLNVGQSLHAFDAKRLVQKDGAYAIGVRAARDGEEITSLTGDTYTLAPSITLITDANADKPIALAGIKGGKAAELDGETIDLVVESANFDGTTTRKSAQKLHLFTDASLRFQNRPSPELAAYGMRDVLALIYEIAGGEVAGVVDVYPARPEPRRAVSVSLAEINGILGSDFSHDEVASVFKRLGLETAVAGDTFTVTPPFERNDITIKEDLVEEVGRILGYDRLPATELPMLGGVVDQARYRGIEKVKDFLTERNFTEVSTQSFAKKGDVVLANPLDQSKPALRTALAENMKEALETARHYAPLVLAPKQKPKLFEIGTTFTNNGEQIHLAMSEAPTGGDELSGILAQNSGGNEIPLSAIDLEAIGKGYEPKRAELGAYVPFSVYPFIARDIALWVPSGTEGSAIETLLHANAGELLQRLDQFDRFEKDGRVSYAYRLIFQSFERTLTDEEVNATMEQIYVALREKGYEIR